MTALILFLAVSYGFAFLMALGSEDTQRSRAGTVLAVWSMVMLVAIAVADRVWDL
jgi:hypothetical protein